MSRSLRRTMLAMAGAVCAAAALSGCSRYAGERAMVEHDHVVLAAQPIVIADVPVD